MSKNPLDALPGNLGNSLGDYLREQRLTKKLSVRQLSALAGVSNPYLSQIERGVKRPSAEILQQIAKGLSISAESLYVQAGLLDPKDAGAEAGHATRAAIGSDPALTSRQRQTLLDIYESFVGESGDEATRGSPTSASTTTKGAAPQKATSRKATAKKSAARKAAAKKSATTRAPAKKTPASTKRTQKKAATSKKAAQKKTTAGTRAPRGRTSAASTKGSARTSGSPKASAPRATRSTTTSSPTSTPRRST